MQLIKLIDKELKKNREKLNDKELISFYFIELIFRWLFIVSSYDLTTVKPLDSAQYRDLKIISVIEKCSCYIGFLLIFFLSKFFFTDTDDSQDSRRREGTIFFSTLSLPPAHEHSVIYLQLCMCNDYHMFSPDCYSMRFTTLSNYHFID